MNYIKLLVMLCLTATPAFCLDVDFSSEKADQVLGHWWTDGKDAKIEIYREGDRFFGKVIWLKDSLNKYGKPVTDSQNPEEELRSRNVVGIDIVFGFVYEDGQWEGGRIYDPENGKTYHCIMRLKKGKLEVKGYIGIPMFGRTVVWTRAD